MESKRSILAAVAAIRAAVPSTVRAFSARRLTPILLAALFVGVGLQVLPGVLTLVLPILVLEYVVLEIFAATCYASGRNPALIAVVDSVFIAWLAVMFSRAGFW